MTRRVLIADDSTMSRLTVKKALPPDWADEILQAKDGQDALDQLAAQPFDVLFLDLTMPEVDGFEVLERLSDPSSTLHRPAVFVLSADIQAESLRICKERGALEFIGKPISAEALATALQKHGLV